MFTMWHNIHQTTMATKCLMVLFLLHLWMAMVSTMQECPTECLCNIDKYNRLQTICNKGELTTIPIWSTDESTKVLIVRGPANISIGPIFNRLKYLEELRITDANVPSVGTHSFWGLDKLKILDLSRNNISTLQDNNFKGQAKLFELDLSQNKIHSLTSWVFQHMTNLKRLNLADNLISALVPRVFYMLTRLQYLDLSNNPLVDLLPNVFMDIMELKEFRCRNCNIKEINPQIFQYILNLRTLDFGDNDIKYINKTEIINCKHLTTLKLDGNNLLIIQDDLFQHQSNLEHLDLSHNYLAKIKKGALQPLRNLTSLDISYNKLMKLPVSLIEPIGYSLKALNISGNKDMDLYDIRESFEILSNLETLFIADMGQLPAKLLYPFRALKALNLSGNYLVNTSLDLLNPIEQLELLDLSRNQLNGFDDAITNRLKNINDVKLENNPLICDRCHMGSLIRVARSLRWNVYPVCALPESMQGVPISNLDLRGLDWCMQLLPDDQYNAFSSTYNSILARGNINIIAIIFGTIFTVVAVVILISLICLSRHRARYYTHEDKRSDLCLEKSVDTLTLAGNEINFKFPVDDTIYTVDELILPPPPPRLK